VVVGLGFGQGIWPSLVLAVVEHVGYIGFSSLQIGQIRLERVESGDDSLLVGFWSGSRESVLVCWHIRPLFVLDNEVVFQQSCLESVHRFAVKVSQLF
jgi:hypothetical protein